ncbi:response regulator [Nitrospira sp. M1]
MRLLLVDDDSVNLQILHEYLEDEGYSLVEAQDGDEAWSILEAEGDSFYAVLLDRMMPKLDGLMVLKRMMAHETLREIPVIMQTAAGAVSQIQEGIEAGAFYYLTKPFDRDMLLGIVASSVRKAVKQREVHNDLLRQSRSVRTMQAGTFRIRTLEDVHNLSVLLANACPEPERIVMGLNDLLMNAIEHGNLGISYDEKTQLQDAEEWEMEIHRRLAMPENMAKYVEVTFQRLAEEIHVVITDQGEGFDWTRYENFSPNLALASHGRGIAMAKALCFDQLHYRGKGNEVLCVIHTPTGAVHPTPTPECLTRS